MSNSQNNDFQPYAFLISLIAIQICLLMNVAFFAFANLSSTTEFSYPHLLATMKTPEGISACVSACVFILMLTRFKPFEFLFFYAFASAGFFGYLAYCNNSDVFLASAYWIALGLITRRLGMMFACAALLASIALGVLFNITFVL